MNHLLPLVRRRQDSAKIPWFEGEWKNMCDSRENSKESVGKRPSKNRAWFIIFFILLPRFSIARSFFWSVDRNATNCCTRRCSVFFCGSQNHAQRQHHQIRNRLLFTFQSAHERHKAGGENKRRKKDTSYTVHFFLHVFNPTFDAVNYCKFFIF